MTPSIVSQTRRLIATSGFKMAAVAVLIGASLGLAACSPKGGSTATSSEDMTLGSETAKVHMVEYASVTCSHCAEFNEKVFPAFKAKYIDTGKVHYTYREFLTAPQDVSAAGILVARCAGKDKYFQVIDSIMRSQREIFEGGDSRGVLLRIAQSVGMDEAKFNACVTDAKGLERINSNIEKYTKDENIEGTPICIINGEKFSGNYTELSEFDKKLGPLTK
jgi:protein-disulfide isomerase